MLNYSLYARIVFDLTWCGDKVTIMLRYFQLHQNSPILEETFQLRLVFIALNEKFPTAVFSTPRFFPTKDLDLYQNDVP